MPSTRNTRFFHLKNHTQSSPALDETTFLALTRISLKRSHRKAWEAAKQAVEDITAEQAGTTTSKQP